METVNEENIRSALKEFITQEGEHVEITDDSHKHANHFTGKGNGLTHITLEIKSDHLSTMTRVNAHRAINNELKWAYDLGLHAVCIKLIK